MKRLRPIPYTLYPNSKGVTLVELTVAMAIFAVAIAISITLFVGILNIQAQANNIRSVQQNIRFTFENFFREVRLARGFYDYGNDDITYLCEPPPGTSTDFTSTKDNLNLFTGDRFIIKNFRGDIVRYYVRGVGTGSPQRKTFVAETVSVDCDTRTISSIVLTELTGPDVTVTKLNIYRDRKYDTDNKRPPALLTIDLAVESYPKIIERPALNQSMESELSISLRSEFCNFNPDACT